MDGSICQIYIAHVTPGGQNVCSRVTFAVIHLYRVRAQSPCALMPLHQKLKSSETVLPLTSKLNRVTQNLVWGEGRGGLKGETETQWRIPPFTSDIPLF